jgi:hypothetical protein
MSADGTWEITMETPMGAQAGTLELKTSGNALTGAMKSAMGEIDLTDGTVDGDNLTWKASMAQPMPMTLEFTAKVAGDEISGDVSLGTFGNAKFSGKRS